MAFDPKAHLMPLKGKDYLQVMWRLVWFREDHPDWCIDTELVSADENGAIFRSKIYDQTGVLKSSGYGSETKRDFGDFLEKAETKSVGRALAMLGYGTQFTEDLDEGERIVDSPAAVKKQKPKETPEPSKPVEAPKCADCGAVITGYETNGKRVSAEKQISASREKFGAPLCVGCCMKRSRS